MLVGLLIILAGIVSAATILRGFAGYLQVFITLPETGVMLFLVLSLGGLAAWGISQSVLVSALITVVEIAGLVLVIAVAAPAASLPPGIFSVPYWVPASGCIASLAFVVIQAVLDVTA